MILEDIPRPRIEPPAPRVKEWVGSENSCVILHRVGVVAFISTCLSPTMTQNGPRILTHINMRH